MQHIISTPTERQLCALARQHAAAVAFIAALLADDAPDLAAARERLDRLCRDTNRDLALVLARLARIGAA